MLKRQPVIENIISNLQSVRRLMAYHGKELNKGLGITITQSNVLFLVKHKGEMTITSLSKILGVTKSASTQLVDSLVEQDLLIKEVDQDDKRIFKIKPSVECQKHFAFFRKKTIDRLSEIFETLDDNELIQLEEISRKISGKNK